VLPNHHKVVVQLLLSHCIVVARLLLVTAARGLGSHGKTWLLGRSLENACTEDSDFSLQVKLMKPAKERA
jgi:hypothetical protein